MKRYRVIVPVTTVYKKSGRWSHMLYTLSMGALWQGEPVEGQSWRHNRIWIEGIEGFGGFVWSGALEEIQEEDL